MMIRILVLVGLVATMGCAWGGKAGWSVDPSFNVNVCSDAEPRDVDCSPVQNEPTEEEVCQVHCAEHGRGYIFTRPSGFCLCVSHEEDLRDAVH